MKFEKHLNPMRVHKPHNYPTSRLQLMQLSAQLGKTGKNEEKSEGINCVLELKQLKNFLVVSMNTYFRAKTLLLQSF